MKKLLFTLLITATAFSVMAQTNRVPSIKGSQPPSGRETMAGCTNEKAIFDFPFTLNGVTVNISGTGTYTYYTDGWGSCGIFCKQNCMWIGYLGPGTMTNTFTLPVNDLVYNLTASDPGEIITITTNTGNPSITYTDGTCPGDYSITGNVINAITDYNSGGRILIHANTAFTSLTFSHNGEMNGTVITMCADSIEPQAVPVSNWAIAIGIGLILAFAVVRFRKIV